MLEEAHFRFAARFPSQTGGSQPEDAGFFKAVSPSLSICKSYTSKIHSFRTTQWSSRTHNRCPLAFDQFHSMLLQ